MISARRGLLGRLLVLAILLVWPLGTSANPPDQNGNHNHGGGGAGGGGGGDPLTGSIYFRILGGDPPVYTMDPDGANKTALHPNVLGQFVAWDVSRNLHGDQRWFLTMSQIDGVLELFAAAEDGTEVHLDLGAEIVLVNGGIGAVHWGIDDAEISIIAMRVDETGSPIEGGVYVADIFFDGDEIVTGIGSPSLLVEEALVVVDEDIEPDLRGHDWSPDGLNIVYNTQAGDLMIADLMSGTASFIPTTEAAGKPHWSPDGSRILFRGSGGFYGKIYTIAPDGSGEDLVAKGHGGGKAVFVISPRWSNTGTHILYDKAGSVAQDKRRDIYRATVGGSNAVNLTSDWDTRQLSGNPVTAMGWR